MANNNLNTPYDDAFRTMLNDCSGMILPVINEIFAEEYPKDEPVVQRANEIFLSLGDGKQRKLITDSSLLVAGKIYHIECQSSNDGTMLIRMFEYDSQIAVKDSELINNDTLVVRFPESAILYLRSNRNTPRTSTICIETPGGSTEYEVKTLMVQDYTIEEIFKKRLLFLIPFHIFSFEEVLKAEDIGEDVIEQIRRHYIEIRAKLEGLASRREITEYEKRTILELSKKVIDALFKNKENVRKGVSDTMGGTILEYEAKDIRNEGLSEGKTISVLELYVSGDISAECAAKKIGCDIEDLPGILEEFRDKLSPEPS